MQKVAGIRVAFTILSLAFGFATQAVADAVKRIDVPAGDLLAAIETIEKQADVEIVYQPEKLKGIRTSGVKGNLTTQDAVRKLLQGTQLRLSTDANSGAMLISAAEMPVKTTAETQQATDLNLARVDPQTPEPPRSSSRASEGSRESGAADEGSSEKGIPEMLVKGRRSSNTDIQRSEDDVQPYVVFKAEDIERSMAGNLEEFLMNRLPMNAAAGSNARSPTDPLMYYSGNQSQINLRGLGANQTLILVNGRRMPGIFNGDDLGQPDINGIALSTVERIEVLPSTAGGIYGGGATGGVINIILKSNYTGVEMRGRYDNTFNTDAAQRRIEANAGFMFEQGRSSIMLSGSYSDSNALLVSDRDLMIRGRELLEANSRGALGNPPVGGTANLRSTNGAPLVLKTGQSLGSNIAHVPYGYAGYQTDGGLPFLATAGRYNLNPPDGVAGADSSLLLLPTQSTITANLRREFTSRIEAFIDASLYQNKGEASYSNFSRSNITLPQAAPNNPFAQNIIVRYGADDFTHGAHLPTTSETLTTTSGVQLRLPLNWSAQLEYGWSRSRNIRSGAVRVITADGNRALADGRLDILRDVDAHPLDYTPYLFNPVPNDYMLEPNESILQSGTGRFAGPIFTLPGGPVTLSMLLERDEHEAQRGVRVSYSLPNTPIYIYSPPRGQTTDSGYIEATAPLISARNALPFVRALDFQASYRFDETVTQALANGNNSSRIIPSPDGPFPATPYVTNSVRANQYTLGLRYQPIEALALRTSFGAGILAPSLGQLAPVLISAPLSFLGVMDPKRGFEIPEGSQQWFAAGDPDLRPEQSRSWSAGAIFTPASLPGLRLSLDYTRIRKNDEITELDPQLILDLEDFFPGRVMRAELTDEDRDAGYEGGVIEILNSGAVNIAHTQLESYDVQADYSWTTSYGTFNTSLIGTYSAYYRKQVLETTDLNDAVSYSDGPLEWRGNAGITWEREAWSAGWNMQYFAPYFIFPSATGEDILPFYTQRQGDGGRIPSQHYHDIFLKYRTGAMPALWGALSDSELMLGISNVFDTYPPVVATNNWTGGGYSLYGDPRLRRYSVSFRKSF